MDRGFIALLFLTSLTGLALMLARQTPALAAAAGRASGRGDGLFATLPYGKFAHGVFRTAALLRHTVEKRQPTNLQLGDE
jgi:citrate/tricarballylate utilization protein